MRLTLALCLTAGLLAIPASASAVTFDVTPGAADLPDDNLGDGICDDGTGSCSLRAAVMQANALVSADVIEVPAGTVVLDTPITVDDESDGDLDITHPVEIRGAGMGETIIEQTVTPPAASDRVFDIALPNAAATVTLGDLTVTGGFVDGAPSNDGGGGVRITGSGQVLIELERVRVTGSVAEGELSPVGGGIYLAAASSPKLHVTDSLIDGNRVTNTDPLAPASESAVGGGIVAGGGVASELVVTGSRITDNEVTVESPSIVNHAGGGLRVNVSSLSIDDTLVDGNSAGRAGGLFVNLPAAGAQIEGSTFATNEATNGGGGAIVAFGSATLAVTNSTLTGQTSATGGRVALMNSGTTLALDSVTIDNVGLDGASALAGIAATLTLRRTIIDHQGANVCSGGTFISNGDNLFSAVDPDCNADAGIGDLVGVDPLLAPLAENGGPTPTMALDPLSPAIDAVGNPPCLPPASDQRGVARPQGMDCDIGAFELRPPSAGVAPATIDFGSVALGASSAPEEVTVTNQGDGSLTVAAAELAGSDATQFVITSDGCAGEVLGSNQSCPIELRFSPTSPGTRLASLEVPHDADGSPAVVAVGGEGIVAPPPGGGDPPPGGGPGAQSLPAQLELSRARIRDRRLMVRGSLDRAAAGERVLVRFRAQGRQIHLRPRVGANGRFAVNPRLRGPQRRAVAGRLSVRFAGNDLLRAAGERLRASRRAVRLRLNRNQPRLRGNRLVVAGRVARRARSRALVAVRFNRANGSPVEITARARVNRRGRFRTSVGVPPAVRNLGGWISITHRGRGPLHGQRIGHPIGG